MHGTIQAILFQDLLSTLLSGTALANGSWHEVCIRGCSIHAVDLVAQEARKLDPKAEVTDTKVDYFLWRFRREKAKEMERFPYHRTRSIYY